MRPFARPVGIGRLSLEARVLYSAFCVFILIGGFSSLWFYVDDELGVVPDDAARYYLGDTQEAPPPTSDDGPALDLGDLGDLGAADEPAAAGTMRFEKPARQVMETFHFHLFSVPVVLLIIGHLFMMCGWSMRRKTGILVTASVTTLLHLLAPPLIRFVSPHFAALVFPTAVLMLLSWTLMTAWPLWEMWRPARE
jgi:hypothetical protein